MQRALTVKGEEARWIKKGGQRDIKGNGGGGRKDSFTAQLHDFLCTLSKKPQIRQGLKFIQGSVLKLLNHSSGTGIVCCR